MSDIERMSAAEIRRNYNEAKDKPYQITILADMNCCKRSDIKKIIDGETDELPPLKEKRSYTKRIKPKGCGKHLTEEQKKEAVRLCNGGHSRKAVAEMFGCSEQTISNAINKTKEENKVIFAEEQTEQEREQLTAEISDKLRAAPIEVIPREAAARVEELVAMESETAHTLPEGATALDVADVLMQLLEEELAGYIVEIKAGKEYYHVRVTDKESGNEVQYQKRRTDL